MFYDDMLETAITTADISLTKSRKIDKPFDNKYEEYTIKNDREKYNKKNKDTIVENYGSGQNGTRIRNAVTGQRYPYFVGTKSEDLFFKVSNATGLNGRKDTLILFYDSPEQFENHYHTVVSTDIKNTWNEKFLIARQRVQSN